MKNKCKNCGVSLAKYPLFKEVDGKKVFVWQNLFKMDIVQAALIFGIILLMLGSYVMLKETAEIQKHPCKFCEDNGCCSQPAYCYEDYVKDNPRVGSYPVSYSS